MHYRNYTISPSLGSPYKDMLEAVEGSAFSIDLEGGAKGQYSTDMFTRKAIEVMCYRS